MRLKHLALLLGLLAASCSPGESQAGADGRAAEGPLVVFAVNHPLACFAQRIGGSEVAAVLPAPPDVDPAFWTPEPEDVIAFQVADLILLNGAGYAAWVERASLPLSRTVDTSASFTERLIPLEEVTHSHGPEGEHDHAGTAFTTWLDPTLALEQARAVLAALEAARPEEAAGFRERFGRLEAELVRLDTLLATIVARDPDLPLLASHPVYDYLARRYDLDLVSLHWEPDTLPYVDEWHALEEQLEQRPARWMLWEDEPIPQIATALAERGIEVVVFRPCGNEPASGDFLDVMAANADALDRAYR